MAKANAENSINGLNQPYPFSPQYRASDKAAAELTLARPNKTNTTLGRQHIEAINAEPEINFNNDFRSEFASAKPSPLAIAELVLLYSISVWL